MTPSTERTKELLPLLIWETDNLWMTADDSQLPHIMFGHLPHIFRKQAILRLVESANTYDGAEDDILKRYLILKSGNQSPKN